MSPTKETVLDKLRTIKGPDFEGDIVSLGLVSEIFIADGKVFFSITVPAERIETQVNKRLQQTAQKAKIAGFRPGKVPMSEIKRRFGADARQEAVGDVIQASFYEAVVEQKLNPAGSPSIGMRSKRSAPDSTPDNWLRGPRHRRRSPCSVWCDT
jgi:hypothetical protein